jgi:hypothetical protein
MNGQQRNYLEGFKDRATSDETERTLYSHDIAAISEYSEAACRRLELQHCDYF